MVALEAIGVVFSLLGIGVLLASCAWLAWWMLEPINRVAGELQGTTRFMLTDVIGLMILLQVGLAISGGALNGREVRDGEEAMYWVLLALLGILILVLWAASVSVVSRAGILRPARRIAVMVLCVPGTLVIMVALPTLIGAFFVSSVLWIVNGSDRNLSWLTLFLLAIGCLLLASSALALRQLAYWSLVGSPGGATLARLMQSRAAGGTHVPAPAVKDPF